MMHEVVVQSTGEITTISDETYALMNTPVPILPFVEDVYRVTSRDDEPRRWFVLFIRPTQGCAKRVERYGRRFGLESYWPKRVRLVARGKGQYRKQVAAEAPLMTRYVMMRLPERRPPFGLFTSHEGKFNGICGFLGDADGPLSVPDDLVQRLVEREQSGEFNETVRKGKRVMKRLPPWAQVNEFVRIKDGALAGFNGIVEGYDGHGKLTIGVVLFGSSQPVSLSLENIAPLQ